MGKELEQYQVDLEVRRLRRKVDSSRGVADDDVVTAVMSGGGGFVDWRVRRDFLLQRRCGLWGSSGFGAWEGGWVRYGLPLAKTKLDGRDEPRLDVDRNTWGGRARPEPVGDDGERSIICEPASAYADRLIVMMSRVRSITS